jgi:hypothetical protein
MQHKKLYITLMTFIPAMIASLPVQAEVEHRQLNSANAVTYVSNDPWQPENFDNGTVIPAAHILESTIKLDGKDDEPQWNSAEEVTVPLYYGSVEQASLKALYTDDKVFIRVRWADSSKDSEYRPWVWDTAQESYVSGSQVDDSVMLSFEAGCEWSPSFLEGYVYDFDAWQWMAARTDPTGVALDLYGSMQDRDVKSQKFTAYKTRNTEDVWNLKFIDKQVENLYLNWDELDRAYMFQPIVDTVYFRGDPDWDGTREFTTTLPAPVGAPENPEQVFPQYSPVKLEGGSAEVAAKGHWENGYWTVEFSRDRLTPARAIYDAVFNRLNQFSVHVFDHTEAIDQSAESGRLFLRFLPEEQILVKD